MKNLLKRGSYVLLLLLWCCVDENVRTQQITCDEYYSRINLSRCGSWALIGKTRNGENDMKRCDRSQQLMFQTGRLAGQFILNRPQTGGAGCTGLLGHGTHRCENGVVTVSVTYNFNHPSPTYYNGTLEFINPSVFVLKYQDSNGDTIVETYVCRNASPGE